ncbi:AAA family ATPase [Legionella septentrionalis]|uniref:AAA family ATPase n=1 Tax=Legionella septentrionalis TaxID=2498109 RepID=UPI0013155084|nr:AAA family ATPase [Legionella septentrionalis]
MKNHAGLEYIRSLIDRGENVLRQIEESGRAPNHKKILDRRWSLKETAELVGRTTSSLLKVQNQLINEGLLDNIEKNNNRITGYTLKQINQFRQHFKTFPRRDPEVDQCLTLAIQTFKGGVGKSVTSVAVAQYFTTLGYRVLFIDMDSQASSTSSFGYIPDRDIKDENTLLPYFKGEQNTLEYCIRKTYWEGLDIIPSNLQLYNLELGIAEEIKNIPTIEKSFLFSELKHGIETVKNSYDVVIMDSPPALGFTSMNILCAADALVIPTPPALYEFSSTVQYLKMIENVIEMIAPKKEFHFIKILATDVFPNQTNHREFLPLMQDVFGFHMMSNYFLHTTEIGNAAIDFQTALEVRRPQKRALNIINAFCKEIEIEVWKTWPSKIKKLEKQGKFVLGGENVYA